MKRSISTLHLGPLALALALLSACGGGGAGAGTPGESADGGSNGSAANQSDAAAAPVGSTGGSPDSSVSAPTDEARHDADAERYMLARCKREERCGRVTDSALCTRTELSRCQHTDITFEKDALDFCIENLRTLGCDAPFQTACADLLRPDQTNLPAGGEPCEVACQEGYYCPSDQCSVCTPMPGLGEECELDSCAPGLVCPFSGEGCHAPFETGKACDYNGECESGLCLGQKCEARISVGKDCTMEGEDICSYFGLTCIQGKCRPYKEAESDCSSDAECEPSTLCVDGRCKPVAVCDRGAVGDLCGQDEHCQPSLVCSITTRRCATGIPVLGACASDGTGEPCARGSSCVFANDVELCLRRFLGLGEACVEDRECWNETCRGGKCAALQAGEACTIQNDCQNGTCEDEPSCTGVICPQYCVSCGG